MKYDPPELPQMDSNRAHHEDHLNIAWMDSSVLL